LEILFALLGLLYAALAVYCYRLGLRDGMRKENGLEPLRPASKKAKPSKEEEQRRKTAQAVENYC